MGKLKGTGMSKAKSTSSPFDADKEYRVKFKRYHKVGRMEFRPLHAYYMMGDALSALPQDKLGDITIAEPLKHE